MYVPDVTRAVRIRRDGYDAAGALFSKEIVHAVTRGFEVAHFLVPMDKVWNDVVYACSNQRLFCSEGCVQAWLARTGQVQGYVMDLTTLWRLASGWYSGRLASPYQRKDPPSAAGYFRSVGLHGPFWGLND